MLTTVPGNRCEGSVNFVAYADVEALDSYPTREALEAYRRERLAAQAACVRLLAAYGVADRLRAVEVGAGSSALLYALELADFLEEGVGIEISASRHAFAEQWRADGGFRRVRNIRGDFAEVTLASGWFHWLVVIDNTFCYLAPENPEYPRLLLAQARQWLAPGGRIAIEINNYARLVNEKAKGPWTFWRELAGSNPFKFALYRQEYNLGANILRTESIYIARGGGEKRKVELSSVYDGEHLTGFLEREDFSVAGVWGDFSGAPFDPQGSERLVVVAQRRG